MKESIQDRMKAYKKRQIREEMNAQSRIKFPNCIGMFPDDCEGVTEKQPNENCLKCPYYKK